MGLNPCECNWQSAQKLAAPSAVSDLPIPVLCARYAAQQSWQYYLSTLPSILYPRIYL